MTIWDFLDKHAETLGAMCTISMMVMAPCALLAFLAWVDRR